MSKTLFQLCSQGKTKEVREFFEQGNWDQDDITDEGDEDNNNALHIACSKGYHEIVSILLDRIDHENVNNVNKYGETAFHVACGECNEEVVKVMLDRLFHDDLIIKSHGDITPLQRACASGQVEITRMLIERLEYADLIRRDDTGNTPLHEVFDDSEGSITQMFIKRLNPEDLAKSNFDGHTPLHNVAHRGGNMKPLLDVLKHDDIIMRNWKDNTPLHEAMAVTSDASTIQGLLDRLNDDDLCINNNSNDTPLQYALVYCKSIVNIKLLLARLKEDVATSQLKGFIGPFLDLTPITGERKEEAKKLVKRYLENPGKVRNELRQEMGLSHRDSGKVFSLVVGLCDDYFSLEEDMVRRFFNIMRKLPIELQMLICNRAFELTDDFIRKERIDDAIIKLY